MYEFPHATYEPSLYLWDALRMSKASGFHVSLTGGKNSTTVGLIVYNMCCILYNHIVNKGSEDHVINDLRTIVRNPSYTPTSPKDICSKLFFTTYLETEKSSQQSKERASEIAKELNSNHIIINFQEIT